MCTVRQQTSRTQNKYNMQPLKCTKRHDINNVHRGILTVLFNMSGAHILSGVILHISGLYIFLIQLSIFCILSVHLLYVFTYVLTLLPDH